MKFNHLNVPTHWRNYWTRYPEGHTILEALISWVSQVDNMVDNQNKLNANVEQFRNEIDEFVGRFDERLQDEVTQTLNDWQTSGFLDVVISEALQWQLDDYIATNEQDKISITAQLQQTEQELSSQLAEINNQKRVNILDFESFADIPTNDWTVPLQMAIDSLNGVTTSVHQSSVLGGIVEIPDGVFGIKNILVKSNVSIVGAGMSKTRLKPLLNDGSYMFYESPDVNFNSNVVANVTFKDLAISPNGSFWDEEETKTTVGVFNLHTNVNLLIENIIIDNIDGTLLNLETTMDSYISNVFIFACCDNYYAVNLGQKNTDLTNAITFNMLHIEKSKKMLYIDDGSRQNKFVNCKFEYDRVGVAGETSPIVINSSLSNIFSACIFITSDNVTPLIYVNSGSCGDVMNGCTFCSGQVDKGYFFNFNNPVNFLISGCTVGSYGVHQFINNGRRVTVSNCTFYNLISTTVVMSFLDNCTISDCQFYELGGSVNMITANQKCTLSNLNFMNVDTTSALIYLSGSDNVIEKSRLTIKSGSLKAPILAGFGASASGNFIVNNFVLDDYFNFGTVADWNTYIKGYGTGASKISEAFAGSIKFNKKEGTLQFYDGTDWKTINAS